MSWDALRGLLDEMFAPVNQGGAPLSIPDLWDQYQDAIEDLRRQIEQLDSNPSTYRLKDELIDMGQGIWLPRSYEAVRLLSLLKQRLTVNSDGRRLVGQIRAETRLRYTPERNWTLQKFASEVAVLEQSEEVKPERLEEMRKLEQLARLGGKPSYSFYQVEGWHLVRKAIAERKSIIITAPTGAGKTEVFMLPLVDFIGTQLQAGKAPHYILIYPRVELLKDQVSRAFKYSFRFNQVQGGFKPHFVIGMQFGGVRRTCKETLEEKQDEQEIKKNLFENGYFKVVKECPICLEQGNSRPGRLKAEPPIPTRETQKHLIVPLKCTKCSAVFYTSLGRNDHAHTKPNILITTIESLDMLYLSPEHAKYLQKVDGLILDEVHLFHSLYGTHVSKLISRIERLNEGNRLVKIASSATVPEPRYFAAQLFSENVQDVLVHDARISRYEKEPSGIENIVFVKAPSDDDAPVTQSTAIQTAMAVGHGILEPSNRTILFTESIDNATRMMFQLMNAEQRLGLSRFRTLLPDLMFQSHRCPATSPADCPDIYMRGECWRGIRAGVNCAIANTQVLEHDLRINSVSSKSRGAIDTMDVVVATAALEVGVDDENIRSTIHYRPPLSVFSFIQRRGRAGRRFGDIATTVVVLGNTATDEFYFRRRNRLIDGQFTLPLNPDNEIVQAMHDTLEKERKEIFRLQERYNSIPKSILIWMTDKYTKCATLKQIPDVKRKLNEIYSRTIASNDRNQINHLQSEFCDWISSQRERFEDYLRLRTLAQELVEVVPDNLQEAALGFRDAVIKYLNGNEESFIEVSDFSQQLKRGLADLTVDTDDEEEIERYQRLLKQVNNIKKGTQIGELLHMDVSQIIGLYDFFALMDDRLNHNEEFKNRTINFPAAMLRLVLQSLFYLGTVCRVYHQCSACLDYFIPDQYFQETKPVLVEASVKGDTTPKKLEFEDSTALASMLIPYKPFYRYFNEQHWMSIIRTEHNSAWVDKTASPTQVHMGIVAEGIPAQGGLIPRKVYVKPIVLDDQETRTAKLCESCFALWSESKHKCKCGNDLVLVRLNASPIVSRTADIDNESSRPIYSSFVYHRRMVGLTYIHGADVEYKYVQRYGDVYKSKTKDYTERFQARYYSRHEGVQPLLYSIRTRGIGWNLSSVLRSLASDRTLMAVLQQNDKILDNYLILHTASHMLHKAVAAISGVNEQVLEYAFDVEAGRVLVWERYEGGAGISEIMRDNLNSDPRGFYRELLASVLCPVHLAENRTWDSPEELRSQLENQWLLLMPEDTDFIEAVVQETFAQTRVMTETGNGCVDGCPACIQTTYCTSRFEQSDHVSRHVAEAIMKALIQETDWNQREEIQARIGADLPVLYDPKQDHRVLVLRF